VEVETPKRSWPYDFVKRHKTLRARTPSYMEPVRIDSIYKESVKEYCSLLDSLLNTYKYQHSMIWQLDETSCQIKPTKEQKRITGCLPKKLYCQKPPILNHMRMLFLVDAAGESLPSQLILPMSVKEEYVKQFKSSFLKVHQSEKGWMNKKLFEMILKT
jgi:hypothetical protein